MALSLSNLKTPGVYIDEVSTLAPSVVPVATAIPAFIGYTETGGSTSAPIPVRITSFPEFVDKFGGPFKQKFDVVVTDSGSTRTVSASAASSYPKEYCLYQSLQFYFDNGGGPCYIVAVGSYSSVVSTSHFQVGLTALKKEDEPTLILFPDAVGLFSSTEYGDIVNKALQHCNLMQDRFTICDVPTNDPDDVNTEFRNKTGANYLMYGAAYMPFLNTLYSFGVDETVLISSNNGALNGKSISAFNTAGADFNPSLYNMILGKISKLEVVLPPSGGIAGIYASVDRDRGVWKAPANVSITGITGPATLITEAQQADLNVDPTAGKSINAIRTFVGRGTIVWGARTLDGNSNEWRYVPVRRLFIMAEESIRKALDPVVFESNDKNTWMRVKSTITNFLTDLWKQGALAGSKPEQAFFVKIGLNETMTAQDILEGKLIVEVGLAAVRPAEFIVLRFMHKLQEA
ncbi:MAG: phage tail sheath subtilisin-like domain-containing protein [Bacteroidia bacterium]|nr:phage tail sheath subtilisin-like domain-containing protein [Bacteroidia bacterium]